MIYQIPDDKLWFPDPRNGDDDGLFAVGGDLSPERLALAYNNGIFPWFPCRGDENPFHDKDNLPLIQWWCPMQRFVIFPSEIHVSHSMRTLLRKQRYVFSINRAFDKVIHNCGALRIDEVGAWLGEDIEKAYTELFNLGVAMSVEVWDSETDELVGGLYGVVIGKAFIGESMFSLVPSGSKMALIFLANWMQDVGGTIIDCQLETSHLKSMGGRYISYDEYMEIIRNS